MRHPAGLIRTCTNLVGKHIMTNRKSTQPAPDAFIEGVLSEIASGAYLTERGPQSSVGDVEALEYENNVLRGLIAKMGWMADLALRRLDSANCIHNGEAEAWLLPRAVYEALTQKVQP